MPHYLCKTCGLQYPPGDRPPDHCPICEDERQYVGYDGQEWIVYSELAAGHKNLWREVEPGLIGIGIDPHFAISQRALLVETTAGNVLWDCTPLLEPSTAERIREIGGLAAMAVSHPHYYASMATWAQTFDVPIYIHAADRRWVVEPDDHIHFWSGDTCNLPGDLTLIRCGGHFEGGQVLHWPAGAGGLGALLTGDILYVTQDRRYVSFMYSYPNFIPLSIAQIEHIETMIDPYPFDRVYSAWFDAVVRENAKANVAFSARRYKDAIRGRF